MNRGFTALKTDVLAFCLIGVISVCAGLLANQFRSERLPLIYQGKESRLMNAVERIAVAKPPPSAGDEALPESLSLEEFQDFVENKRGIVLDARPEIFHRLGHVPGAISLPREDFENAYQANRAALETDKTVAIAIYCSGADCEDSDLVQKALRRLGFERVTIFSGGWTGWTAANLPEERKE